MPCIRRVSSREAKMLDVGKSGQIKENLKFIPGKRWPGVGKYVQYIYMAAIRMDSMHVPVMALLSCLS